MSLQRRANSGAVDGSARFDNGSAAVAVINSFAVVQSRGRCGKTGDETEHPAAAAGERNGAAEVPVVFRSSLEEAGVDAVVMRTVY